MVKILRKKGECDTNNNNDGKNVKNSIGTYATLILHYICLLDYYLYNVFALVRYFECNNICSS